MKRNTFFLGWILGSLLFAGCADLFSPKPTDHSTAKGDATHTTTDTTIDAGGDARVSNWTFNGGGYAAAALAGIGLWWSMRAKGKESRALIAVVDAIEQTDCKDCKKCIARRGNEYLNRRIAKLTGRP